MANADFKRSKLTSLPVTLGSKVRNMKFGAVFGDMLGKIFASLGHHQTSTESEPFNRYSL